VRYGKTRRIPTIAPLLALAAGCGSTGHGYALDVGSDESGVALLPGSSGEGGASSLAVSIAPAAPVLCPGQCADLSARAVGGTGPYAYQWDHGLPAGAGPEHVCPNATTTYTVVASDSSGHSSGELSTPPVQGSASVTVTVSSSCSEAGVPIVDGGGQDTQEAPVDGGVDVDPGATADADASSAACVNLGPTPWSSCETISTRPTATQIAWFPNVCQSAGFLPVSLCLPHPLLAGQSYQFLVTFDSLAAIYGGPYGFALWGAAASCVESQKLTEQQLPSAPFAGTVTFPFCVTADAEYPALVWHWLSTIPGDSWAGISIQVCSGCGGGG
jgi:hypothetical protein